MQFLKHIRAQLESAVTLRRDARLSQFPGSVTSSKECLLIEWQLPSTTYSLDRQVSIEGLSDKVLLKIFCYFLDAFPRLWTRLVHICRRWRCIVFEAQQTLHLRLFCTHGTPVLKTLHYWPALPIVVQYGGSLALGQPTPKDEDNIIAVLKQSDRVSSITLTVTSSLLNKLSTIERPFLELEDLVLLSRGTARLTLPGAFRWGSRLRCLHLTRIAFPSLLQLLYSSKNLIDLQLYNVLNPSNFSPDALTEALSRMTQLRSLSLHFLSNTKYRAPPPPSGERFVLPLLTHLNFRGVTNYLEDLVAITDAPCLEDIHITLFDDSIFGHSELGKFINRIGRHKSHRQAYILTAEHGFSVSLIQPGTSTCLKFQLLCEPLSVQLCSMARFFKDLATVLFNVVDLHISATRLTGWLDSIYLGQWVELLNSFTGVKRLHLEENHSKDVLHALQVPERHRKIILPALHKLYILQRWPGHAPLTEAALSLMTSRRRSGRPIVVEYKRQCHTSERSEPCASGIGPFSRQVTLSDDILLNIFHHYLKANPQIWPALVWVCQSWRQIIFTSPLGLNLRLHCMHGTHVLRALNCWPALPIVLQYGGAPNLDPPAPEDNDNIIAALKQSDRVRSISLTLTGSLVDKLSAISEPISGLEELALFSRDSLDPILPSTFRWGSRLRTLHSTRIAFPSFPALLLPSQDLVDLRLDEIPSAGYFPPEALANALLGLTLLETLSLHFLSLPSRRNYLAFLPLQGARVILPALTCLKYRGTSKYLDSLVARIDAPHLEDIDITFFYQPTMDVSQIGRFIERIDMQRSLSRADVQTSAQAISICFTSSYTSTRLRLQISCRRLDWQLSCMAQVCDQFSPFLFRVEDLAINTTESSSGKDDLDSEQWLDLVCSFASATDFRVAGELTADVLRVVGPADGDDIADMTVLPSLRVLRVHNPLRITGPFWHAVQSIIASRRRSGRPVELQFICHGCNTSYTSRRSFKAHLVDEHGYRLMCSYCGDFECNPRLRHRFREHLANEHTEVARNDALISGPIIYSSELQRLVNRHSSLCAPDIVAPDTTAAAHSE